MFVPATFVVVEKEQLLVRFLNVQRFCESLNGRELSDAIGEISVLLDGFGTDQPFAADVIPGLIVMQAVLSCIEQPDELVMPVLCQAISGLEPDQRISFQDTLVQSLLLCTTESVKEGEAMFQKLVGAFQSFIMLRITSKDRVINSTVKDGPTVNAVLCLEILNEINDVHHFIPYQSFYNESIESALNLKDEYPKWKGNQGFSFLDSPFLLGTATKGDILKIESMITMRHELQDSFFRAMFIGVNSPYLQLEVRRDNVIRDAILQVANKGPHDLKKQLRITFVGEEGVDEGGVQKEFFQLVVKDIFDPNHGMFEFNPETRACWFVKGTECDVETTEEYSLIGESVLPTIHGFEATEKGKLLGLAIYNSVILDITFPLALYKKVLKMSPTLEDLYELDPLLAKGLKTLLDSEEDIEEVYGWTFEIQYETHFGTKSFDLKRDGASFKVNASNRKEFVRLYVDFIFNQSVKAAFSAFLEGFNAVVERGALLLFRPEELQELVIGSQSLDFHELEKGTQYDGGFEATSPIIVQFWEIAHALSNEDKKRLLFFTTGSDRVPAGGLSKLQLIITRNGPDTDRIPTSHTCYNVLLLNEYSSKERLEKYLMMALENSNCGFFLM